VLRRPPTLDEVFRALADPTRRAILVRLERSRASTSALAADFDMALPSFLQHLNVLEQCGLIRSMKLGRIRMYRLVPKALQGATAWLGKQHRASAPHRRPPRAKP
jgi:DNA-binding transcriptional ArsR family regulator